MKFSMKVAAVMFAAMALVSTGALADDHADHSGHAHAEGAAAKMDKAADHAVDATKTAGKKVAKAGKKAAAKTKEAASDLKEAVKEETKPEAK